MESEETFFSSICCDKIFVLLSSANGIEPTPLRCFWHSSQTYRASSVCWTIKEFLNNNTDRKDAAKEIDRPLIKISKQGENILSDQEEKEKKGTVMFDLTSLC